jgi:hypothetical protein
VPVDINPRAVKIDLTINLAQPEKSYKHAECCNTGFEFPAECENEYPDRQGEQTKD